MTTTLLMAPAADQALIVAAGGTFTFTFQTQDGSALALDAPPTVTYTLTEAGAEAIGPLAATDVTANYSSVSAPQPASVGEYQFPVPVLSAAGTAIPAGTVYVATIGAAIGGDPFTTTQYVQIGGTTATGTGTSTTGTTGATATAPALPSGLLGASELADLQGDLTATFFDTAQVWRATAARDAGGAALLTFTALGSPLPCQVYNRQSDSEMMREAQGGAVRTVRVWRVLLPVGSNVLAGDQLSITTQGANVARLKVTATDAGRSLALALMALCTEVV